MKRKIIACLLSLSMLCGLLPMAAFATSAEEPISNEDSTSCTTCGQTNCDGQHENWCDICKADNCGKTHVFCESCNAYDCGIDHSTSITSVGDELTGGGSAPISFYDDLMCAASLNDLYDLMTDENNEDSVSALTFDELTGVKNQATTFYTGLTDPSYDESYQYNWLVGKIDALIAQDEDAFAAFLNTCTCSANKSREVVHDSSCPAYVPLPEASVTLLEEVEAVDAYLGLDKGGTVHNDVPLTHAMQFATLVNEDGSTAYTDMQLAYYGDWVADFVITTNKPISGKDAYLAGQYDAYDEHWVWLKLPDDAELQANTPMQMITMLTNWNFPFSGVVDFIPTFNCGIWISEDYLNNNPGFAVDVELRLYPTDDTGNYDPSVYHTLSEASYQNEFDASVTVGDPDDSSDGGSGETSAVDPDETYLFTIYGEAANGEYVNLQFVAKAGETVKIAGLPDAKDAYTIEPVSGWKWREAVGRDSDTSVNGSSAGADINFKKSDNKWLSGYAYASAIIG